MIQRILRKHKGAEAFETVLVLPIVVLTFYALLVFFYMAMAFVSYNTASNMIAESLNTRQSAFWNSADKYNGNLPTNIKVNGNFGNDNSEGLYLLDSDLIIHDGSDNATNSTNVDLRSAVIQSIVNVAGVDDSSNKNHLLIPFSKIDKIDVVFSKPIANTLSGNKGDVSTNGTRRSQIVGTSVKVKIYYHLNNFRPFGWETGRVSMYSVGYNVIS
jgi:hypothetical protein